MNFYSCKIKKLDSYNLDKVILYNSDQNVILEYQFAGYKDLFCPYCFFFNPEVHKTQAIALDENSCLKHIKRKINKGDFILLEGDLNKISKEVFSKKLALGLIDERMSF